MYHVFVSAHIAIFSTAVIEKFLEHMKLHFNKVTVILVFIKVTVILVQIFKLTATPVSKTLTFKIGQHLGTHALVCLNKIALDVGFRHQEIIEG